MKRKKLVLLGVLLVGIGMVISACGGSAAPVDGKLSVPVDTVPLVSTETPVPDIVVPVVTDVPIMPVFTDTPVAPGIKASGALSPRGEGLNVYLILNYTNGDPIGSSWVYVMVDGELARKATCKYEGAIFVIESCIVPVHYQTLQVKVTSGVNEDMFCTLDIPAFMAADRQIIDESCTFQK